MTSYTTEEVAEICKVHRETVRRWIRSGDLPAAQIGDKEAGERPEYRVSKTELARFWRERGGGELFDDDDDNHHQGQRQ